MTAPAAKSARPAKAAKAAKPAKAAAGLADKLARLGLAREEDLVLHLPLRYEDHTRLVPLARLQPGLAQQAEGTVVHTDIQYRPRRQLVCLLEDGADGNGDRAQLVLRFFTFYPNQQKALAPGRRVRAFGDVRPGHFGLEIVHPQFQVVDEDTPLPDRLTPVYPTTAGLGQDTLRRVIARAIAADPARTADSLPADFVARRRLWKFGDAVRFLHTPPPELSPLTQHALDARTHPAWTRLKFDELVAQQLSMQAHRNARAARHAPVLTGTGALTGALLARVPFKLTRAQERVWREIRFDLAKVTPMQRLLQGDVGSGKTIVAALAALQAIESGRQVAFMAPTEILAEQHYRKLAAWLEGSGVGLAWVSGSQSAKERKAALAAIASGEAPFVIGTHALFEDDVLLPRLGLAIVDEQHRFGVAQRLKLRGKAVGEAHQLMMSATPIPRTLAMTFYADLDVSVLDEMPPGRTPVATRLVSSKRRAEVVERVRRAARRGAAGVLGVPADRGVGEARAADRRRAARGADRDAGRPLRRAAARAHEAGGQGGGDGRLRPRRGPRAGRDHRRRGRRRRAERVADGDRARRALRPRPAAPAARAGRPRRRRKHLLPAVRGTAVRAGQGPAQGDLRAQRRLRDRAAGPRHPRSGRVPGRAAVGGPDAALRRPGARRGADRGRPRRGVELLQKDPAAAAAHLERWLGGRAEFIKA